MRKIYTILLSVFFCATTAVAQETIITQPADGETINLYRTTTGFESVYYYGIPHKSTGDWQRLVFGNDGAVYLENPLNSLYKRQTHRGRYNSFSASTSHIFGRRFFYGRTKIRISLPNTPRNKKWKRDICTQRGERKTSAKVCMARQYT